MPLTQKTRNIKIENLALSGTAYDVNNLPAWASKINLMITGFSSSGTNSAYLRIGAGGIIKEAGYKSNNFTVNTSNVSNSGNVAIDRFKLNAINVQTDTADYLINLTRSSGNKWHVFASGLCDQATDLIAIITGYVELTDFLDIIRITFANGTDTIDGGIMTIEVFE